MEYEHEIRVRHINNKYHARLYRDGKLVDEMACKEQRDIGFICRKMLRNQDHNGFSTEYTTSARKRHFENDLEPHGKIYQSSDLSA